MVALAAALVLSACSSDNLVADYDRPQVTEDDDLSIPESQDECPGDDEVARSWDDHGDGCPGSVNDLVDFAGADIGSYWDTEMRHHGLPYSPPSAIVAYEAPLETPCGPAANQAFYCPDDGAIYYDIALMEDQFDAIGPYAPVLILAHEWARLIQHQLSMAEAGLSETELELQADCFAGAYTRRPAGTNLYDDAGPGYAPGLVLGAGLTWTPFSAASSPDERITWFYRGFEHGLDHCLE